MTWNGSCHWVNLNNVGSASSHDQSHPWICWCRPQEPANFHLMRNSVLLKNLHNHSTTQSNPNKGNCIMYSSTCYTSDKFFLFLFQMSTELRPNSNPNNEFPSFSSLINAFFYHCCSFQWSNFVQIPTSLWWWQGIECTHFLHVCINGHSNEWLWQLF